MLGLELGRVLTKGGRGRGPSYASEPPQDGLIADWRFAEGSGTTVADETGGSPIDLTLATTPNVTWADHGISLPNGAVQTPSRAGIRTTVMIYRTAVDDQGFHQTWPVLPNDGPLGSGGGYAPITENYWIGHAFGLHKLTGNVVRTDGGHRSDLHTGGWRVLIRELAAGTTGAITVGSRSAATTNRNTQFDLRWLAEYNRTLTPEERDTIYSFARGLLLPSGDYMHPADCPTQVDCIVIYGDSEADGRGLVADMSAPDQARVYAKTKIAKTGYTLSPKVFSTMAVGATVAAGASYLGVEIPLANLREDDPAARPLYFIKTGVGGVRIAPRSLTGDTQSLSAENAESDLGFWGSFLENLYYATADAMEDGIGLTLKGVILHVGGNDAVADLSADVYEAQATAVLTHIATYTGVADFKVIIPRLYESTPDDATAYATVRAAQAAVVTALGSRGTLIDTDALSRGDYLHLDADGYFDLADLVHTALWG